jgi:hypothetical protein
MSRDEEAMFGKCWDGYKKVGMKNKSGRRVPNCVRKYKLIYLFCYNKINEKIFFGI